MIKEKKNSSSATTSVGEYQGMFFLMNFQVLKLYKLRGYS